MLHLGINADSRHGMGDMKNPPPGSDAAMRLGCMCPVVDNHHGEGFKINGEIVFLYSDKCPVHPVFTKDTQ